MLMDGRNFHLSSKQETPSSRGVTITVVLCFVPILVVIFYLNVGMDVFALNKSVTGTSEAQFAHETQQAVVSMDLVSYICMRVKALAGGSASQQRQQQQQPQIPYLVSIQTDSMAITATESRSGQLVDHSIVPELPNTDQLSIQRNILSELSDTYYTPTETAIQPTVPTITNVEVPRIVDNLRIPKHIQQHPGQEQQQQEQQQEQKQKQQQQSVSDHNIVHYPLPVIALPTLADPDLQADRVVDASLPQQGLPAVGQKVRPVLQATPSLGKETGSRKQRHALIMATIEDSEISWALLHFQHLELFPYATWTNSTLYHVPANKGKEAMTYLTFIIDNYADLPDKMVFLHGHRTSWHQHHNVDIVELLKRLRWDREEYTNLRCERNPGCINEYSQGFKPEPYKEMWDAVWVHHGFGPLPDLIKSSCCAQFLVPKAAVLKNPLAFYVDVRQWLLTTTVRERPCSVVFEYTWHMMFGHKGPIDCPSKAECQAATYHPK